MADGFCTHCNYIVESFDGLTACPNCGTDGRPCAYENQVPISVNIHELRILCMWAENYAAACEKNNIEGNVGMRDLVYAISNRLQKQLRTLGHDGIALTMADEFRVLKEAGYDFQTNHPCADDPELPPGTYIGDEE